MEKKKYVRLTKQVIEQMFEKCNKNYFHNKVEKPQKFETWTPAKQILGLSRPMLNKRTGIITSALHISRRYGWAEDNLRQVVVHEMIHLYIEDYKRPLTFLQRLPLIGRFFLTQHDSEFISVMNELNATYGLDIKVRFPEMKCEFRG